MKNFENLGRKLSKEEQKEVGGGDPPGGGGGGCTQTYTGCNYSNGQLTCDYHVVCTNGYVDDLCGLQCQNPGDGSSCLP